MENKTPEDSKICAPTAGIFLARPRMLKFFFDDNIEVMEKELTLTNLSDKTSRLSISPPMTKYFKIKYSKKFLERAWIAPGLSVSVKLIFKPDMTERQRHYKDFIRIMWGTLETGMKKVDANTPTAMEEEEKMKIPLHAQPHNLHCSLPDKIFFGVKSRFTIFPMQGQKVVYFIVIPKGNTDFTIYPTYGVLNEKDMPQEITIEYQPSAYKIMELPIQVCIPNCSMTPYIIRLTGICKPWKQTQESSKAREENITVKISEQQTINPKISNDTHSLESKVVTYDDKISQNYDEAKTNICHSATKKRKPKLPSFPLNTIHGVSKFLSMKPGQDSDPYFHLMGPLGMYQEDEKDIVAELEKKFKTKVQLERQRLQHIFGKKETAVGPSPNDPQIENTAEILVDRTIAMKNYEDSKELEKPEFFLSRKCQLQLRRRVMRDANEGLQLNFTSQPDNMWFFRYQILSHFVQSVRKVIIQNRLLRRLKLLKENKYQEEEYMTNVQHISGTDDSDHQNSHVNKILN